MNREKFDGYAQTYDALTTEALRTSGEGIEYFADYKLSCLKRWGAPKAGPVLDFGCGVGNVTSRLASFFTEVHGHDSSSQSLTVARQRAPAVTFHDAIDAIPNDYFDTAVLSCVLHHVPRSQRLDLCELVRQKLRHDGRLFVFEHNPLNPLTLHMVHTCEYDDDADLLWPWSVTSLLRGASYRNVNMDFIVFFPRLLSKLRPLEPRLTWLPIGAQTLTVGAR